MEQIPVTWVLLRTTGVVAIVVLTLAVVLGILSPSIRSASRRLVAISMHNAAAAVGSVLLLGHVVLAVSDSFVEISPLATVVPGLAQWEPLWVGVGTVAVDLILLVLVTSWTRLRAPSVWRRIHLLANGSLALAWLHALVIGTDTVLVRSAALFSVAAVVFAATWRIAHRRVTTAPTAAPAPAPAPAPVPLGGSR